LQTFEALPITMLHSFAKNFCFEAIDKHGLNWRIISLAPSVVTLAWFAGGAGGCFPAAAFSNF